MHRYKEKYHGNNIRLTLFLGYIMRGNSIIKEHEEALNANDFDEPFFDSKFQVKICSKKSKAGFHTAKGFGQIQTSALNLAK